MICSADCFPSKSKDKVYLLKQAFHINDPGLVWEQVPYRTFYCVEEKSNNDFVEF